jgi:hypothetical protein
MVVWLAFPVAGYLGWWIGGRVDATDAALLGGAVTGAGLGAAEWWAAKGALGRASPWIGSTAVGYAVGLAAGATLVGYDTDLGALAVMGLVSGAVLGAAQGLVLGLQGRHVFALWWALAMPALFALGWSVASVSGVGVDDQFTVFGAGGALVFTLLSGVLLAHFTPVATRRSATDAVDQVPSAADRPGEHGAPLRIACAPWATWWPSRRSARRPAGSRIMCCGRPRSPARGCRRCSASRRR